MVLLLMLVVVDIKLLGYENCGRMKRRTAKGTTKGRVKLIKNFDNSKWMVMVQCGIITLSWLISSRERDSIFTALDQ